MAKIRAGWCGLAAVMILSACTAVAQAPTQSSGAGAPQPPLSGLPATFKGTLPCADCPGIDFVLDLKADHTYASRMTYQERNAHFDDSGTWSVDDTGKVLTLHTKNGGIQKYAVRDSETLRPLDGDGHEIESKLNYALTRAPDFMPLKDAEAMDLRLEDTEWTLVKLDGKAVIAAPKPAYLLLNSASHRVSGSGGCNRLVGSYELAGSRLKFGQMASTRMACAQGMETEQALQQALGEVSTWKITSGRLELFDSGGKLLATFEPHNN